MAIYQLLPSLLLHHAVSFTHPRKYLFLFEISQLWEQTLEVELDALHGGSVWVEGRSYTVSMSAACVWSACKLCPPCRRCVSVIEPC